MARPDGALVTGQRLTCVFAGPVEHQAEVAQLIEAVGLEPHWVGEVRYSRNLEVRARVRAAEGRAGTLLALLKCWEAGGKAALSPSPPFQCSACRCSLAIPMCVACTRHTSLRILRAGAG